MTLKEAINASEIWSARGYNSKGECVCSVAFYGGRLVMLAGFDGNWASKWESVDDDDERLEGLVYRPTGPKPDHELDDEIMNMLGD